MAEHNQVVTRKNRVHSQNDQTKRETPRPGTFWFGIFLAAGGVVEKYIDPLILIVMTIVSHEMFFRYRFQKVLDKEKIECPDSQNRLNSGQSF